MKQPIIFAMMFILMISIVYAQPLNITPDGYWQFEEGSGTNATDSSGNENHGEITGANYVASSGGNRTGNYSLNFDGINDFIFISDNNNVFQFGDGSDDIAFTMMTYAYITDVNAFRIVFKNAVENEFIWGFTGANKFLLWLQDDSTAGYLRTDSVISMHIYENQWIHLATTYDGLGTDEGIKHYLNGVPMSLVYLGSGSYTAMEDTGEDTTIFYDGASNFGQGRLDELVVIYKELTEQEINEYINEGFYSEAVDITIPSISNCAINDSVLVCNDYIKLTCNVTDENLDEVFFGIEDNTGKYIQQASLESGDIYSIVKQYTEITTLETYNFENATATDLSNNINITILNINYNYTCSIDTTNPEITLISPINNTINNSFPMDIYFEITDNSDNIMLCILKNDSQIFDSKSVIQGNNFITLQIENVTELSQNFPNLDLTCYDNTEANNSATMLLNYTIDKVLPLMIISSPEINATFNKVFVQSAQIHTTCYDDNVYRLNVTISNSSNIVFSEEDMNPVDDTLEINSLWDFSLLGTGVYQKIDYCADTHTAKTIPNYNTLKIADKGIRWTTPTGNEFELKCSYSEGILSYGTYKSPDNDKYIFYYIINDTEDGSEFEIECEMENRKFPVAYLSNSPYPAHFIMEKNWMDFRLEDDEDAKYEVSMNYNFNYKIIIRTTKTNLTFGSVGELNFNKIISQITIVYEPPREDEFVLGVCPVDSLPRAIMFMFFFLLAFLIMGIGYTLRNGLIGVIGSLLLIGMGVFTWFCLAFVSLIVMGLGVIMMSMFVFKGINAFR